MKIFCDSIGSQKVHLILILYSQGLDQFLTSHDISHNQAGRERRRDHL